MYSIIDNVSVRIAAIFLNGPKSFSPINEDLWARAKWRTVVDGFANVLFESNLRKKLRPDLITGDFDSISKEALDFYEAEMQTEVVPTPDQNFIDMEKSIQATVCRLRERDLSVDCLVVSGIAGGRCDHAVANLHSLRRAQLQVPLPVYLLTEVNVTRVLLEGRHEIDVQSEHRGETCGVIPLFEPAVVSTQGLRWNLDKSRMSMTGLISTSNKFATDRMVVIETDRPILFTCEVA